MKIAVIGSGIAGLSCAWRLAARHHVTLYEANHYLGGHSHTVEACVGGLSHPVDTGFLVFNQRTYPRLVDVFATLGVETAASEMSFSVSLIQEARRTLEWAGTDLNSVFAQRRNLVKPRFLWMLRDIMRFNASARALAACPAAEPLTLGEFLSRERYSASFRDWYLLPMAAAIWSCSPAQMARYPMASFVRFCHNHGLLQITDRPQWYTVVGGAREYVKKMASAIAEVRLDDPIEAIRRAPDASGTITVKGRHESATYAHVVLACHSDQALKLLDDPSAEERSILGAIGYQPNRAVLHTDISVLPRRTRAWAAWNYQCRLGADASNEQGVCVHYLINRLQPVPFKSPVIVSLNPFAGIAQNTIQGEYEYSHPVFDAAALDAQRRLDALQGRRNTWFAGAWTGYGFHEDGLRSGLAAADAILACATPTVALAA